MANSVAVLLSYSQPHSDLSVLRFTLAVVWLLLPLLLIRIVVVLRLCNLGVASSVTTSVSSSCGPNKIVKLNFILHLVFSESNYRHALPWRLTIVRLLLLLWLIQIRVCAILVDLGIQILGNTGILPAVARHLLLLRCKVRMVDSRRAQYNIFVASVLRVRGMLLRAAICWICPVHEFLASPLKSVAWVCQPILLFVS